MPLATSSTREWPETAKMDEDDSNMLNLNILNWRQRLTLLAVGMAIFAASSLMTPKPAYTAEDAALVP